CQWVALPSRTSVRVWGDRVSGHSGVTRHLWDAIRKMRFGDVLQIDLFIGVAGGAGGLVLGLNYPAKLVGAVSVTAGVVGVVGQVQ
ncbi:hypothetical protein, partial [Mycobacterium avium]|uniref:hypothetical protein n=1 Tax=Mycobacterium avium TaxID=1764 RepID=UPI001F3AC853